MSEANGESSHQRLKPGARIGRYRLLAPLASGGMAEVWAAKPEGKLGLSRTVAMKVVKAEYARDEEYTRLLIDEATVASAVHHPNVCDLLELDRDEDLVFMVMEWVAGDSLAGILHQGSAMESLRYHVAVRILADSCAGAHAAHEACDVDGTPLGIVHRDISPPNILLSLQGQVKVSDFGIAKARHQLHSRTRTGEVKGKFAYIPSEQIAGTAVDRRADVYALGCVLYVATLGLRPFGSGPQAMSKILRGQYKRPRELKQTFPEDLEAIIVKALQQDREHRYSSAGEMRQALEAWLTDHDHVVTSADLAHLVERRLSPEKRAAIEELRKLSRANTMSLLMSGLEIVEREQTPTAGSGLVMLPEFATGRASEPGAESGASERLKWDTPAGAARAVGDPPPGAVGRGGELGADRPGADVPTVRPGKGAPAPAAAASRTEATHARVEPFATIPEPASPHVAARSWPVLLLLGVIIALLLVVVFLLLPR